MNQARIAEMTRRLAVLATTDLVIEDQSKRHAGHAGAKSGGGHFVLKLVSSQFAGQPQLQRHRAVYAALGDMLRTEIHALQIVALTPQEAGEQNL